MAAYTTIDDPSAHFQTALYTGTGSTQSITNDGNSDLQPDWVWVKKRNAAESHALADSSRGTSATLFSDLTNTESSSSQVINSFNSDGFQVGTEGVVNDNTNTYVAWQWKAGGGTTTNQTGANIDSVTQANTTAGFSIVTYTGNGGTGQSVKHGLGTTPKMIWVKRRDGAGDWFVYHSTLGNTKHLHLNTTAAVATTSDFGNYGPDATSFFVNNTGTCINTETYVAYCFAEVQGYSKFGKYVGNGNSNGPFIYTGFKPALVIVKATGGTTNWRMNGPDGVFLSANTNEAVYDSAPGPIDRVSNGFKIRGGDDLRASGGTFIYMAWATNPFVTSTGVPTTAGSTGPAT